MQSSSKTLLGEAIKKYRKRAGMSQMQLEEDIGAANGSISRLEQSKVNPTRDTLYKIIEALELSPIEATMLFELSTHIFVELIETVNNLHNSKSLEEMLQVTADEVNRMLSFTGGSIYRVKDNEVSLHTLSATPLLRKVEKMLPFAVSKLSYKIEADSENLIVKAVLSNQYLITHKLTDLITPPVPKRITERIQKASGAKSMIILPHSYDGRCYGVSVFGKHLYDEFEAELGILLAFSKVVTSAMMKLAD